MSFLISKFTAPTIPVLKITGFVNSVLVNQIQQHLQSAGSNVAAIALVINSKGGSQFEIDSLQEKIKIYASEKHLPIYTFATDHALEGALRLLTMGNHVYAQRTSKLGHLNVNIKQLKIEQFFRHFGFLNKKIYSNNNLWDRHLDSGSQIIQTHLQRLTQGISNDIALARPQIKGQSTDILFGEEALKLGYVDKIGTYEDTLSREFPNAKLITVSRQRKFQQLEEWFQFAMKVSKSRGFIGLVLLLFLKGLIKWSLILYVWNKSKK